MLEFVKVTFPDARDVFVNNVRQGQTGQTLRVPRGRTLFDLGEPRNYAPDRQIVLVNNTTQPNPQIVAFSKVAAVTAVPTAPAVAAAVPAGAQPALPDFAIASEHSPIFHVTQACWAASRITDDNVVFGDDARQGRTQHVDCG